MAGGVTERLDWVVASMTCSLSNAFGFFLVFWTLCSVDFCGVKKVLSVSDRAGSRPRVGGGNLKKMKKLNFLSL